MDQRTVHLFKRLLGEQFVPMPHAVHPVMPTQHGNMAEYLLAHSFGAGKTLGKLGAVNAVGSASTGSSTEQPGFLSRLFDTMANPMYSGVNIAESLIANPKKSFGQNLGHELSTIGKATAADLIRSAQAPAELFAGSNNPISKAAEGYAQKLAPKKFTSDILDKHFHVKNPWLKYGGEFVGDVAFDPTTYVPGLDVVSMLKKARDAKLAMQGFRTNEDIARSAAGNVSQKLDAAAATGGATLKNSIFQPNVDKHGANLFRPVAEIAANRPMIPKVNPADVPKPFTGVRPSQYLMAEKNIPNSAADMLDMQAARRVDNAKRAANVRWGKPIDWHDIPDMTAADKADFIDKVRQGQMAKKGVVSDAKGNISAKSVQQVMNDIANGSVPRFTRQAVPAEGVAATEAQKIAEDFIKKPSRKLGTQELGPADQANLYQSIRNKAVELVNNEHSYNTRFVAPLSTVFKRNPDMLKKIEDTLRSHNIEPTVENVTKYAREANISHTPQQTQAIDYISRMLKAKQIENTKAAVTAEVKKLKYLRTNSSAQTVVRHFFPAEKIQNFALTKPGMQRVDELALSMLRSAEDHLIATGHNPTYWNGMRARLSDVMSELGGAANGDLHTQIMKGFFESKPSAVANPAVQRAISEVIGRRALSMSDLLSNLSDYAAQAKKATELLPTPKAQALLDKMPKAVADGAKVAGATKVEAKAFADMVRNIVNVDDIGNMNTLMERLGPELTKAVAEGRTDAQTISKINNAIIKAVDLSHEEAQFSLTGSKAIDSFFLRWSTWAGRQSEMKKFSQDAFLFGEQNAADRAHALRQILKGHNSDTILRAFKAAQSDLWKSAESDPKVAALSGFFRDYFDWMLGSTGFKDIKDFEQTAAVRSSFVMADVNKHLKAIGADWKFTDTPKAVIEVGGQKFGRDYKKLGWLQSWEYAAPHDPVSYLYDVDLALQRTMAEYNLLDEFGMRFGAKKTDSWFKPDVHTAAVPNPRLKDMYFHPEVKAEFMRLINDLERGGYHPNTPLMRFVGKATRIWKSSVTIYYPSHHIRNLIGDVWNTWAAGHNDVTLGWKAAKVLASQKTRYGAALKDPSLEVMQGLIDKKALELNQITPHGAVIFRNKKFGNVTAGQLWAGAYQRGLLLRYNKIEDIFGESPFGHLTGESPTQRVLARLQQPFGGRAHQVATQISEYREHYVRMMHFIGAVDKNLSKHGDLQRAMNDAAHEVRKWHPDGTDLSINEQKLRYLIPFYSWTRKEIPLLLQTMLMRPSRITAYPKVMTNVQGALGIQTDHSKGFLDPFPDNQLFPDWIRANGIGPIGDPESSNPVASFWGKLGATVTGLNGQPSGYTIVNPSNPFNDMISQSLFGSGSAQDIGRAQISNLNPLVNVPAYLMLNQTFSGAPIAKSDGGQGYASFLLQQSPQISALTRLTGIGGKKKDNVQGTNRQNLINILTALGIRGTGPYIKSAQFEAKQRAINNAKH